MTDLETQTSALDVDIGLLIKLVKNFPYLYNQNYEEFKNIQLKERTWNKISSTLKIPASDCNRIWRNLRDKYSKERRNCKEQPEVISQWEFYDAMKFLNPFIKRRRRAKKQHKSTWPSDVKVKIDIEDNDDNTNHSTIVQKMWDGEPVGVNISPENISFLESEIDENGEAEEITVDMIEHLPVKEIIQEEDKTISIVRHHSSEEAFGAYVASRLLDFSMTDRQAKKVKIFKILEDLEELS